MSKELHEHEFKLKTEIVPLRRYVKENGKMTKDLITGKDTLSVWVCDCGFKEAVNLERIKA